MSGHRLFDPQEDTGATQASLALTGRIWLSILRIFNLRFIHNSRKCKEKHKDWNNTWQLGSTFPYQFRSDHSLIC